MNSQKSEKSSIIFSRFPNISKRYKNRSKSDISKNRINNIRNTLSPLLLKYKSTLKGYQPFTNSNFWKNNSVSSIIGEENPNCSKNGEFSRVIYNLNTNSEKNLRYPEIDKNPAEEVYSMDHWLTSKNNGNFYIKERCIFFKEKTKTV